MYTTDYQPTSALSATWSTLRGPALLIAMAFALPALLFSAQDNPAVAVPPKPAAAANPDLSQPTLYVVGYAHLDTEWRWEYPQVISEYLAKTMHANFYLFEKYPHYIFNFSGANRYRMMKEYFPADYESCEQ